MGESTGIEGSEEASEAGALPEGGQVAGGSTAGAVQRDGVPPLRSGRRASADIGAESLDLMVALDEPDLLMGILKRFADDRVANDKWAIIASHAGAAIRELQAVNEPATRA